VSFGNPNQLSTPAAFPGLGRYVLRLTANDGARASSDDLTVILERIPSEVTLVQAGAVWKYLDDGSDQGSLWRTTDFDDASWRSGAAKLGYGDGDVRTVLRFGPNSSDKFRTYYFRHAFNVGNTAAIKELTVSLVRDDGAIVYLNGIEIFRSNMPAGEVGFTTFASAVVGGGDETAFFDNEVNPSALRAGRNVLAVELHQVNAGSSDLAFDLALTALAVPDNQPPFVDAGPDAAVDLAATVLLRGAALDDGLPTPPGKLTVAWSKLSGPGEAGFTDASSAVTTVRFSAPGTYVLRLTATDGSTTAQDDTTVTVSASAMAAWLAGYFTVQELSDPAVSGEEADPDQDGHPNRAEFITGTNPKDPASVLRAESVSWAGESEEAVRIRFHAQPNVRYVVECQDFVEGPWRKVADLDPRPAEEMIEVTDAAVQATGARFYRIVAIGHL
jgi:hypothetical protein